MKLYHLIFRYGEYSDYQEYYLGTYSSNEERKNAIQAYRDNYINSENPCFIGEEDNGGEFETFESELNENIYLK